MQKFSLISPDQIRNSLTNTSPTKAAHAFTKSRRFTQINPQCKIAFYSTSSSLSRRKTSLGYGHKFDFTKSSIITPAPNKYRIKGQFDMNKTFSFPIGRDQSPQQSFLYRFSKNPVPGPGTYENQVKTQMTISYTNRAKTVDVIRKHLTFLQTPGPAKYDGVEMNPKTGKFKISKFKDSKFAIISKDKRFKQKIIITPGPSTYKTIDSLNDKGRFILSQRRGKGTRPFDHQQKFKVGFWKTNQNPGPGQYDNSTEFGVYGDSNYYKTLRTVT